MAKKSPNRVESRKLALAIRVVVAYERQTGVSAEDSAIGRLLLDASGDWGPKLIQYGRKCSERLRYCMEIDRCIDHAKPTWQPVVVSRSTPPALRAVGFRACMRAMEKPDGRAESPGRSGGAAAFAAAAAIEGGLGAREASARVYCSSDVGSMLEYRAAVSGETLLPYMDTRAELFCSGVNGGAPIKEDLMSFLSGDMPFGLLSEKYRFDACLLLSEEAQAYGGQVEEAGFDKVLKNDACVAYVKR